MTENDRPGESLASVNPANDAKPQAANKPISEWTAEDFLAAGINVVKMDCETRVVNTATSPTGMKGTGFSIVPDRAKQFKFAK